jgi:uncharacterized membrane protein YedE/YeeE
MLVHLSAEAGLLVLPNVGFFWLPAIAGGFVFGVGMTLAAGCSTSSYYRVGEGMAGSFVVVLMFVIFAGATSVGALYPVAAWLRDVRAHVGGSSATLYHLLGLNPWWPILAVLLPLAVWAMLSKSIVSQRGWSWRKTGTLLGLIAGGAWLASFWSGDAPYGLRLTGPSASLLLYLTTGDVRQMNWGVFELLGVPLGAFVAATRNQEFHWRVPKAPRLMLQALGGSMMGVGAVVAGGCNIGNSLTGLALMSLTSLVATISLILGTWAGTYLFFVRTKAVA